MVKFDLGRAGQNVTARAGQDSYTPLMPASHRFLSAYIHAHIHIPRYASCTDLGAIPFDINSIALVVKAEAGITGSTRVATHAISQAKAPQLHSFPVSVDCNTWFTLMIYVNNYA